MPYGIKYVSVHLGLVLACIPVLAAAQTVTAATPGESPIVALIDPALRSPLASPTVQLAVEVGDGSKYATGKVGLAFSPRWTGEVGFTGAFDQDLPAQQVSSLRRLTDGSSAWGAATWTASHANRRATPMLSARFEASRSGFDFYDRALSHHTDTHAIYAMTATAGLLLPRDALAAVSYRTGEVWQVADEREACRFVAERGDVLCPADSLFRAPASYRRDQFEAQLQARLGDKVGAAVYLTRDFRDEAWGLDLPVYFIARPDGGFTGGLVMTYNGARDRFDVSVFVGQVFNLSK
jgi:hypothetical protein